MNLVEGQNTRIIITKMILDQLVTFEIILFLDAYRLFAFAQWQIFGELCVTLSINTFFK